jgi:thiol-disulfide isomerase/thioredoxin
MKQTLLTFFILYCSLFIYSQPFFYKVKINGNNFRGQYLYISYETGSSKYVDSILLNGKLQIIKKNLPQPIAATFSIVNQGTESSNIFLANNSVTVSFTNNKVLVTDKSMLQKNFLHLIRNDIVRPKYFPLYGELTSKNDTIGLEKLSEVFDSLRTNDIETSKIFLQRNGTSLLSLFAFMRFASFAVDYSITEPYFLRLPNWAKETEDGKNIALKISSAKSVQINTKAPLFESPDSFGEQISLANYTGSYIFIDFWASWCGPCRKEHPALKDLYSRFKNKNFNIISISLDDVKTNWQSALSNDQLPWINTSELKGFQAKTALLYGVQAIPANFLINPTGIIIAKNVTPDELLAILKKELQ